jgi:hypothetical protein
MTPEELMRIANLVRNAERVFKFLQVQAKKYPAAGDLCVLIGLRLSATARRQRAKTLESLGALAEIVAKIDRRKARNGRAP